MRLIAQRVQSSQGQEGINAFCYLHGPIGWLDKPPTDIQPGKLANSRVEVPPPGNRIRSFLELVTPDVTPSRQVLRAILDCIDLFENKSFPLDVLSGDISFQFDLDLALAPGWRQELEFLLHHALAVRV
jgi:hypothetical protein